MTVRRIDWSVAVALSVLVSIYMLRPSRTIGANGVPDPPPGLGGARVGAPNEKRSVEKDKLRIAPGSSGEIARELNRFNNIPDGGCMAVRVGEVAPADEEDVALKCQVRVEVLQAIKRFCPKWKEAKKQIGDFLPAMQIYLFTIDANLSLKDVVAASPAWLDQLKTIEEALKQKSEEEKKAIPPVKEKPAAKEGIPEEKRGERKEAAKAPPKAPQVEDIVQQMNNTITDLKTNLESISRTREEIGGSPGMELLAMHAVQGMQDFLKDRAQKELVAYAFEKVGKGLCGRIGDSQEGTYHGVLTLHGEYIFQRSCDIAFPPECQKGEDCSIDYEAVSDGRFQKAFREDVAKIPLSLMRNPPIHEVDEWKGPKAALADAMRVLVNELTGILGSESDPQKIFNELNKVLAGWADEYRMEGEKGDNIEIDCNKPEHRGVCGLLLAVNVGVAFTRAKQRSSLEDIFKQAKKEMSNYCGGDEFKTVQLSGEYPQILFQKIKENVKGIESVSEELKKLKTMGASRAETTRKMLPKYAALGRMMTGDILEVLESGELIIDKEKQNLKKIYDVTLLTEEIAVIVTKAIELHKSKTKRPREIMVEIDQELDDWDETLACDNEGSARGACVLRYAVKAAASIASASDGSRVSIVDIVKQTHASICQGNKSFELCKDNAWGGDASTKPHLAHLERWLLTNESAINGLVDIADSQMKLREKGTPPGEIAKRLLPDYAREVKKLLDGLFVYLEAEAVIDNKTMKNYQLVAGIFSAIIEQDIEGTVIALKTLLATPSVKNWLESSLGKKGYKSMVLIANLGGAKDAADAKAIIEAAAEPLGSYRAKYDGVTIALNGFIGPGIGGEWQLEKNGDNDLYIRPLSGVVGVDFSFAPGRKHHLGFMFSLVDVFGLVVVESDGDTEIDWGRVFAPGMMFRWGMGGTPLVLFAWPHFLPLQRDSEVGDRVVTFNFVGGFAVDVPIVNFSAL